MAQHSRREFLRTAVRSAALVGLGAVAGTGSAASAVPQGGPGEDSRQLKMPDGNYITVSAIGYEPPGGDPKEDPQKIVERQINFWQGEFAKVLPDRPDLIVVPETCDTPYNCQAEQLVAFYKARGDRILESFAKTARTNRCYITYPSLRQVADGTWRNSMTLLDRSGHVAGIYNKNYLTIYENTDAACPCLYGKSPAVIECDFGRVGCAICFDLNFDELRLQYVDLKPDLMLFCSMFHGGMMQNYWAYSCRCHLVSAVWRHSETSQIIAPTGELLAASTNYFDYVTSQINLDCRLAHLSGNDVKLTALKDKYGRQVRIHDPGQLGPVLITSETKEVPVKEMIEEFKIELLDDFLQRCLAHRREPGRIEP